MRRIRSNWFRALSLSALITLGSAVTSCSEEGSASPNDRYGTELGSLGSIVINEFSAGTTGFIELYNTSTSQIDVGGWQVDDVASAGKAPKLIPAGTFLKAKGWLSVPYGGVNTASADDVRLLDASGKVVDSRSNGWDGTSLSGFCFGRSPDGGTWASSALVCSPDAKNATDTGDATADIVVNEFGAGSAGWIELYNRGDFAADLSGWYVDDVEGGSAAKALPAGSVVGPKAFLFVKYAGINTASADEVRVLDPAGDEVDSTPNLWAGVSISGKCYSRVPDGGDFSPEPVSCSGGSSNAATEPPPSVGSIVINEFRAGSSGWIELYNPSSAVVQLSGWRIDDIGGGGAAAKTLPEGTVLVPKQVVYFAYTGINSASADEVRLLTPGGAVVDSHPNGWTGTSIASVCFGRATDGGTWESGTRPCTPGASNGGGAPVTLRLNEFMPGSEGFVEIRNQGAGPVDLAGWKVDDAAGGGTPVAFPTDAILQPNEFAYVMIGTISATAADDVRLLDPSGKVVDSRKNYVGEDPCPGVCYGRVPDGGSWAPYSIGCSGGSGNPTEVTTPCLPGSSCDDGDGCTTGSTCTSACVCGSPTLCNDNNPCTNDACGDGLLACQSSALGDGLACGTGLTCEAGECRGGTSGAKLVLNEFSAGPNGWVELLNTGNKPAFLAAYSVNSTLSGFVPTFGDSGANTSIPAGARIVVPYGWLKPNGLDFLSLYRAYGPVESVSNFWTSGSTDGLCFARLPDGSGTFAGKAVPCTKGMNNGSALTVCSVGGACNDGNACTTGEKFTASCSCAGGLAVSCEDGDPCTAASCDPLKGCSQTSSINFTSCGTSKVCIAGQCKAEPACTATGGTYKSVTFTKAEECTTVSFMNKARYSQMNAMPAFARNQIYDCDPVTKTCLYRTSRWTSVAELLTVSGTSPVGTTSLTQIKSAAKGFTPSGLWYDTIESTWTNRAALSGGVVGLEKAFFQKYTGNDCVTVRDTPTSSFSLIVCRQLCYGDGGCEILPEEGTYSGVRGRLVFDANFPGGGRWVITSATFRNPNPSF
ncbi:MAG: lamin tail domain-containing protein [Myxococcales bacterium]|nr:lamin tail domain-containing protein [Myxococcales bacterium]